MATLAAAATVCAASVLYHTHVTPSGALWLLVVFALGSAAWAAAATALTSVIPTVEAASPVLMLVYFPVIIISGVFGTIDEPGWLHSLARVLPAQPLIQGATRALGQAPVPAHDLIVLGAWTAVGLAAAIATFRWAPHRPTRRRAGRLPA